MPKIKATFRIGGGLAITAIVREAQTIIAVIEAGPKRITSLEMHRSGWALRLAAYICDLRKMGVPIHTRRERHDGGYHRRYFLAGPVQMVAA